MEMDRPHIENTTRYYHQRGSVLESRVREKEEDQKIHGEETWKKIAVKRVVSWTHVENGQRKTSSGFLLDTSGNKKA
jgi:hypothetical protein